MLLSDAYIHKERRGGERESVLNNNNNYNKNI